jgi:hypothetical protein
MPRLWPSEKIGAIGYMLDQLQKAASEYRVHYLANNPFDQDITDAKTACEAMIPLRADFGRAVTECIDTVVEASWFAGYAVTAPKVLVGIYSVAVVMASEKYVPQLALVQARYGTFDSSVSKLPGQK